MATVIARPRAIEYRLLKMAQHGDKGTNTRIFSSNLQVWLPLYCLHRACPGSRSRWGVQSLHHLPLPRQIGKGGRGTSFSRGTCMAEYSLPPHWPSPYTR